MSGMPIPSAIIKPKRKQVKMAVRVSLILCWRKCFPILNLYTLSVQIAPQLASDAMLTVLVKDALNTAYRKVVMMVFARSERKVSNGGRTTNGNDRMRRRFRIGKVCFLDHNGTNVLINTSGCSK